MAHRPVRGYIYASWDAVVEVHGTRGCSLFTRLVKRTDPFDEMDGSADGSHQAEHSTTEVDGVHGPRLDGRGHSLAAARRRLVHHATLAH